MKAKVFLRGSAATLALALVSISPAIAQTTDQVQDAPKPVTASDQSTDPASPQASCP